MYWRYEYAGVAIPSGMQAGAVSALASERMLPQRVQMHGGASNVSVPSRMCSGTDMSA